MKKNIVRILVFIVLCFFFVLTALTVLLPQYIESSLLPSFTEKIGISRFQISRPLINLSRAETSLRIGDLNHPALSIGSLSVDYSLPSLFLRKIKKISINGLELRLHYENNRLVFDDTELKQFLFPTSSKKQTNPGKTDFKLPFTLEQFTVEQSTIIVRSSAGVSRLPFQARINFTHSSTANPGDVDIHFFGHVLDQDFSIQCKMDPDKKNGIVKFSTEGLDLHDFFDHFTAMPGLMIEGLADMSGEASVSLSPFALERFDSNVFLYDTTLQAGDLVFTSHTNREDPQKNVEFTFTGTTKDKKLGITLSSALPDIEVKKGDVSLNLINPTFQAEGLYADRNLEVDSLFSAALQSGNEDFTAESPEFKIEAHATKKIDSSLEMEGSVKIADVSFAASTVNASVAKGEINVPFVLPFDMEQRTGVFEVGKISWNDLEIAGLNGKIEKKENALKLTAYIHSPLLPDFSATASLVKKLFQTEDAPLALQLTIPPYQLKNFSLKKISPDADPITLSGLMSGQAIFYPGTKEAGTAALSIEDGSLFLAEKNIRISGLQSSISLPHLPHIRSEPRQKLSFVSAQLGDIEFDGGTVFYTLESANSLFVEQSNVKWVKGSIDTYALRFSGKSMPGKIIIFCNKLKLAALLEQLGIQNVSGDGTVNGRIPVTFGQEKITFEESFLYSTPGEGGVIKIGDADFLTRAIPTNTQQFAQLDFVQEALRNFDYSWAKIHLVSEDDILVMQLKLDGKSADPLPFTYDSQTGRFKRIKLQNNRQGISHPIRLDANFRFPLDTFLDYDKSIKNMLQLIQ